MKARQAKSPPSVDLLVCFPPRAHLTLMPKPICSPARPSEPTKRRHHVKKIATRGGGQASTLLWAKNKQMGSEIAEPTSPKVTCAGQIKVRPRRGNCKSWQSVVEEIERIHNKNKKKPSESLGFKKDILQFLACLRKFRFDFRCFGSFPQSDIGIDDDEDGEEEEEVYKETNHAVGEDDESSRAIFSKWFMVLQENRNDAFCQEKQGNCESGPAIPPPNALLLMRCRSAPTKSWVEEKEEEEEDEDKEKEEEEEEEEDKCRERRSRNLRSLMDEVKEKVEENLVVMKYGAGLCKISTDVSKETWLVGGTRGPLSRSRSWKQ